MTRYRRKPEEIEAWRIGTKPVPKWIKSAIPAYSSSTDERRFWRIENRYGAKCEFPEGGYLIRQEDSVTYIAAALFEQTYEVV